MGSEAACTVRVGRKNSVGKALLESETLAFRGDFKLDIPMTRIGEVIVDGGVLVVRTPDQEARFDLGPAVAQRWARLIKEPKGLLEKLELTPQSRVAVVGVTDAVFLPAIRERVASIAEERVPEGAEIIFFGAEAREALQKVPLLRARMIDTGALWIVRPKAKKTITEADVFEALRSAGLVDTKVVAFSRTHTAHKCVVPVEMRGQGVRPRPPFVSLPPPPSGAKPRSVRPAPPAKAGARAVKKTRAVKTSPKKAPPARPGKARR